MYFIGINASRGEFSEVYCTLMVLADGIVWRILELSSRNNLQNVTECEALWWQKGVREKQWFSLIPGWAKAVVNNTDWLVSKEERKALL